MKKCWIIIAALLLSGCGAQETWETVADVYVQPVSADMQQLLVDVPQDAHAEAMQNDTGGKLYLCDGFTVSVQTLESGDLEKTLRTVTGYSREALTLIQTQQEDMKRYECVWTAAGEGETQVGRTCVLDDGNYHYAVTVMAGESQSGALAQTWQTIFDSVRLVGADVDLNTGS